VEVLGSDAKACYLSSFPRQLPDMNLFPTKSAYITYVESAIKIRNREIQMYYVWLFLDVLPRIFMAT
jgi:hypothetical protein